MTIPNIDQHYEVVTLPDPAALARQAAEQQAQADRGQGAEQQAPEGEQAQQPTPEQVAALQAENERLAAERNQATQYVGQVQQQQMSQRVSQQLDQETAQYTAQLQAKQVPPAAIADLIKDFREFRYATMMAGPWALQEAQELARLSSETGIAVDDLARFRDPNDRRQFALQAQLQAQHQNANDARIAALEAELAELRRPSGQTFESGANGQIPRGGNGNFPDQQQHIDAFAQGRTGAAPVSVLNELSSIGVNIPNWPRGA